MTPTSKGRRPPGVRWIVVLSLLALGMAWPAAAHAQRMVFLVRHAERADAVAPGGQMQAQTDPLLSAAGQARAEKLAAMLADAGVTTIIATEYRRTQDTGKPLAARLGLTVGTVEARETDALVATLASKHRDEVVLLIGHSNTVPALVQALGGPALSIGENEYDNLFVVVPATGAFTRIRY